jgi:uncharacterized protein YbjT (DUF2867 family)
MSTKKVIAVVGATGAQGGSLVRAIAADPQGRFAARALTRDPDSSAARELAALGAEVVRADVDDEASLRSAFADAYGAYCVTFFWAHFSPEREIENARAMAQAAREAGLQHVIWSTLEDTRNWIPPGDERMPTLMGRYKVPHFDAKGEADAYFAEADVPTTYLLTSFYWDNLIHFGMGPKPGPDGRLAIAFPMGDRRLPGIATEDIGKCALGIFHKGHELIGRRIGIAGEHPTCEAMARTLGRELGREVVYHAMEPEDYRRLGFPGADDLGNMFQFNRDFADDFCGARDIEYSRSLNPQLKSFADWVAANRDRIPVE